MPRSRARRPSSVLFLLTLLLALAAGCDLPGGSPAPAASGGSSAAEAEKTREMEDKAAEYQRHAEEVRNMEGTEQEKIDAMNSLDQERRDLNEMSDGK